MASSFRLVSAYIKSMIKKDYMTNGPTDYRVEVKHRPYGQERYSWEIHRAERPIAIQRSVAQYSSWEQAGRRALKLLLDGGNKVIF